MCESESEGLSEIIFLIIFCQDTNKKHVHAVFGKNDESVGPLTHQTTCKNCLTFPLMLHCLCFLNLASLKEGLCLTEHLYCESGNY